MQTHTHTHTHTHTDTHAYVHTFVHTHIHKYINISTTQSLQIFITLTSVLLSISYPHSSLRLASCSPSLLPSTSLTPFSPYFSCFPLTLPPFFPYLTLHLTIFPSPLSRPSVCRVCHHSTATDTRCRLLRRG
jgi:hypothetical protein